MFVPFEIGIKIEIGIVILFIVLWNRTFWRQFIILQRILMCIYSNMSTIYILESKFWERLKKWNYSICHASLKSHQRKLLLLFCVYVSIWISQEYLSRMQINSWFSKRARLKSEFNSKSKLLFKILLFPANNPLGDCVSTVFLCLLLLMTDIFQV